MRLDAKAHRKDGSSSRALPLIEHGRRRPPVESSPDAAGLRRLALRRMSWSFSDPRGLAGRYSRCRDGAGPPTMMRSRGPRAL